MAKLITIELETSDYNEDAVAWIGYFNGAPSIDELQAAFSLKSSDTYSFHGDPKNDTANPLIHRDGVGRYELGYYT